MQTLQGVITKVFKHDKNTGFSILQVKGTDEASLSAIGKENKGRNYITVLGNHFSPKTGGFVTCEGQFSNHPKFGSQFKAKNILLTKIVKQHHPCDIIKSRLFKNMDSKVRYKLAKKYGNQVLRMLNVHSQSLLREGIVSEQDIHDFKRDWMRVGKLFRSFDYLRGLGMTAEAVGNVVESHGNTSKDVVSNDPYSLLDVTGVGFSNIDVAASSIGMEMTSTGRLTHGLKYLIKNFTEQGNTAFYLEDMAKRASTIMNVDSGLIKDVLLDEVAKGSFTLLDGKDGRHILVDYTIYKKEMDCAKELKRLMSADIGRIPDILKVNSNTFLNAGQKNAVINSVKNPVSIITGGPGVGKTTTLSAVLDEVKGISEKPLKISLAAPTAMAAERMSESTGIEAHTIHSLLDYHPDEGFRKNQSNMLDCDILVIDETSMVDIHLFLALLRSVPTGCRLVFVGDKDQLPSVGPGAVLADMIRSGRIPCAKLTKVERQDDGSQITEVAHSINEGKMPDLERVPGSDFHWVDAETDEDILNRIRTIACAIPARLGVPYDKIQVLSPQKGTIVGVDNLNKTLRPIFNPKDDSSKFSFMCFGREFKVNDRVMQVRNNKEMDLCNGEVGKIRFIDFKSQNTTIDFEKGPKEVPFSNFGDMRHSIAMTAHKSQGSEYPVVIIPVSESHANMLSIEILYTAATRARSHLIMVGSRKALEKALSNKNKHKRHTLLADIIADEIPASEMKVSSSNDDRRVIPDSVMSM